MLNLMAAMMYQIRGSAAYCSDWNEAITKGSDYMRTIKGFCTQDFLDAIENFPISILPERRRNRSYLTSILAGNEIDSTNQYSKKLFYRTKRGYYLFSPTMLVPCCDEKIEC